MAEHGEEYLAVLKASYDYEPQSEDEIAIKENQIVFLLEKTDDDWWKVKIKGESQDEDSPLGLVPAAYVEQAEHTSVVKALYDYDAAAPGELTIKEDEVLMVFDREDDWILVQSQKDGGKAGFIPGNYVEESTGEEEPQPTPAAPPPAPRPQIIVPPSPEPPARPVSVYVDPADRVAQAPVKAQADNIKTWAVSEVDKKGKKKKGTLGIGNGSLFFASESDKTPVQKWDTADVQDFTIEKHKHVLIDMGGANPMKLHFNVGKEEIAETILTKLDDSHKIAVAAAKAAAAGAGADLDGHRSALTPSPRHAEAGSPSKKNGASVRFAEESPEIIPPRSPSVDGGDGGEEEEASAAQDDEEEGEPAVALYDFEGTGSDELSVQEGERLHIVEKEGDEWWKCRNAHGVEGVVPASYLESLGAPTLTAEPEEDDSAAREEEERQKAERKERQRQARERVEKERKKAEQERAKAAEAERKRREKEEAAAAAEAQRKQRQEAAKRAQQKAEREQSSSPRPQSSQSKPSRESSSTTRGSSESRSGPPPESTRIWHDRSGQFRVEAALLGFSGGKLRLHKINGVVIEVPSEKMSVEDIRYVERLTKKKAPAAPPAPVPPAAPAPAPRRVSNDDDDQPLALKQAAKRSMTAPPPKKGPTTDWFEFFLSAGCDIDDCTRYAHSFERDKIDESILPDITESTMRSLGLREGDIIRVNKVIQQKFAKPKAQDHIASDEELARRLQEEENGKKATSPAPNLFAGPGGLLKNNTTRRGRPQPSKSLPPPAVDLDTIGSASDQIKRTGSPLVRTSSPAAASPVQPPQRSSSALTTFSGFDDDAWTNRPGSAKPAAAAPTPPPAAPRAPSAPPAPQPAAPAAPAQPQEAKTTGTTLAKTDADIFDQLARLTQLRTNNPATSPAPASAPPAASPPVVVSPPIGYNNGLGMGSSPAPLAQHLQNQQTGVLPPPQQNGPRGPFAPVPANQSLLQPLIPTQTGFNNFVPTRPNNVSPFQSQPTAAQPSFLQTQPQVTQPSFLQTQPQVTQPSFLQSQPTGFPGNLQPLISQPTGFPGSGPMMAQPTGIPGGTFGNFTPTPSFANTNMAPVQTNPTGFSPFGQSPFNNVVSTPSPAPSLAFSQSSNNSTGSNTSPANIFAQMKSGTFASGNEHGGPQQPEKYDALRPQPTGWAPPNGWGFQNPNGGFQQSGYTGY